LHGSPVEIGHFAYVTHPRNISPSGVPVDNFIARWGDQIALLEYELLPDNGQDVTFAFRWQALQRMEGSFKFFIHLVNADTNEIVSQVDIVPINWSYPTNWWERGEFIEDVVGVSVIDLPAGTYELRAGWYDPGTSERLPITSDSIEVLPDNTILLHSMRR